MSRNSKNENDELMVSIEEIVGEKLNWNSYSNDAVSIGYPELLLIYNFCQKSLDDSREFARVLKKIQRQIVEFLPPVENNQNDVA